MKNSHSSNIAELLYRSGVACAAVTAIFAIALGGIQIAGAETEVSVGASVNASAGGTMPPRLRPGAGTEMRKEMRDEASSTRKNIINATQGIMRDFREDNMMMRASTTLTFRENRASTTAAMKARKQDLLKQIVALKGEKKQQLNDEKKQKVDQIMNGVYKSLGMQIDRLTRVDATLAAKISEESASGTDMAKATSLLATAQTALAKAKVDYGAAASLSKDQTASSTSASILKNLAKTAEASIRAAAKAYKSVADEMKPYLLPPTGIRASSTSSVSASTTSN